MSSVTIYERNRQTLWRRVGNEILLAPAEGNDFNLLSDTASQVWLLLDVPSTAGSMAKRLGEKYGMAPERIEGQIVNLLDELANMRVVEAAEGSMKS